MKKVQGGHLTTRAWLARRGEVRADLLRIRASESKSKAQDVAALEKYIEWINTKLYRLGEIA